MKKLYILLGCVFLTLLTGCNNDTQNNLVSNNSSQETLITSNANNEYESNKTEKDDIYGAYISIQDFFWNEEKSEIDYSGSTYKDSLNEFICLTEGNEYFHMYFNTPNSSRGVFGKFKSNESYRLSFENCKIYNAASEGEYNGYTISHNLKSVLVASSDSMYDDRTHRAMLETMNDADINDYLNSCTVPFNLNESLLYIHSPYYKTVEDGITKWKNINSHNNLQINVKNSEFIVTEQKGYSFDSYKNDENFSLLFDNSDIDNDSCSTTITFKNNIYTIQGCKHYPKTEGEWFLFKEHILVIKSPYEECPNNYCVLYVDFDKQEIAIPAFIKCNDKEAADQTYKDYYSKYSEEIILE